MRIDELQSQLYTSVYDDVKYHIPYGIEKGGDTYINAINHALMNLLALRRLSSLTQEQIDNHTATDGQTIAEFVISCAPQEPGEQIQELLSNSILFALALPQDITSNQQHDNSSVS